MSCVKLETKVIQISHEARILLQNMENKELGAGGNLQGVALITFNSALQGHDKLLSGASGRLKGGFLTLHQNVCGGKALKLMKIHIIY